MYNEKLWLSSGSTILKLLLLMIIGPCRVYSMANESCDTQLYPLGKKTSQDIFPLAIGWRNTKPC